MDVADRWEPTTAVLSSSDAVVIGPEHNRIWRATYAGLLPASRLDSLDDDATTARWLQLGREHEHLGCSARGASTWVAHDPTGRPAGWMSVGPARDDDAPCPLELWALYVTPEHWGAGVAATLVHRHLPPGPAYLWVLQGNERAIAFYRKHGFRLDGATKPLDPDAGAQGGLELRMTR